MAWLGLWLAWLGSLADSLVCSLAGVGLLLSVPRCTSRRESRTDRTTTSTTTSSQPSWHLPLFENQHLALAEL